MCWLNQKSVRLIIGRSNAVVGSIPGRVIPKDVKRWELAATLFGVQHLNGIEQRRSGAAQWLPGPRSIGQKDFPVRTIKSLLLLLLLLRSVEIRSIGHSVYIGPSVYRILSNNWPTGPSIYRTLFNIGLSDPRSIGPFSIIQSIRPSLYRTFGL